MAGLESEKGKRFKTMKNAWDYIGISFINMQFRLYSSRVPEIHDSSFLKLFATEPEKS